MPHLRRLTCAATSVLSRLRTVVRPPSSDGAIAQLGERLLCKQEVVGSIPSGSTRRPIERRPIERRLDRGLIGDAGRSAGGACCGGLFVRFKNSRACDAVAGGRVV